MAPPVAPFSWHDGERTIHFGRGIAVEAVDWLGGPGYTLLTTERASTAMPWLAMAAASVQMVAAGPVDELAGELLGTLRGDRLVALGGGRVIDVAKALAAATGGRAMAVPTTLSGAEMTRVHRHATGAPAGVRHVRPAVVVTDPELAASQPEPELASSALNALAHAAEGPCTERANPVATLAAHEAARLVAAGFARKAPDRDALALGALLAGYTIDSTGYGLHHVLAQTLVRTLGVPHGAANAVLLPHTLGALAWRFPRQLDALAAALGGDPAELAVRVLARSGTSGLRALGVEAADLRAVAEAAARRPDLEHTPPAADRAEILALYEHAL
jgi:alcohol dehydrogenase class IV